MTPMRRAARIASPLAFAALACGLTARAPEVRAEGEETRRESSSVAATNGVVVHGVDSKLLAARLRDVDGRLAAGQAEAAGRELADLASADLDALLEEGEGTYLSAQEAVLLRTAELPEEGLAVYRRLLDARARAALDAAVARGDPSPLQREAFRLAMTTDGPRLLVTLADLRLARGDLGGAARALEDLLRLRPEDSGEIPGVPRAAVVSRLAALGAARGDAPAVRALLAECGEGLRAQPSPTLPGRTLAEELTAAAAAAEKRAPDPGTGPVGPARLLAETVLVPGRRERGTPIEARDPDVIRERPIAVGTAEAPVLLVRRVSSRTSARVDALAPAARAADAPPNAPRELRPLWTWPASAVEEDRPPGDLPFAPARLDDDLVAFTWPAPAAEIAAHGGRFAFAGEERHQLVVLSLRGEGRLVDERGRFEDRRSDGDPVLETLSFCGRPAVERAPAPGVEGGAVYVSLVRHAESGDATELHVARFDVLPAGRDSRLRLRWRRHVLDGSPLPPARHPAHQSVELMLPAAAPSAPLVRNGRVYVASNTGAVACLDASTGRPEWVETYERFGPSTRTTVREVTSDTRDDPRSPTTWGDAPLQADGSFLFAAPRDSEALLQYLPAPRRTRALRVESFPFAAPSGTARRPSRLLPDVVPFEVAGVRDGVAYLSGRVARRPLGSLRVEGSPLAAFPLASRRPMLAQVQELGAAGTPCFVAGAILFPTGKAIYRVPLDDFEGAPAVLWRTLLPPETRRGPDRIGVLVPDGKRLWSVTPTRVCLFE